MSMEYESTYVQYHSHDWENLVSCGWITWTVEEDGFCRMIRRMS